MMKLFLAQTVKLFISQRIESMNKLKRLIWCALLFGIQALYFPLNRYLQGGTQFKTSLDDYIPVWSVWVLPYALICWWWVVAYLWAAGRMEERLYEAFFLASAVMQVSALTIFTLFPTYVIRPALLAEDWSSRLLNWIYANDYTYNAFPSGHVYITTLIAFFWSRWFPRWRWLWAGTVVIIILATLFTGQHYLPDPIGGLALAWLSYRVGLWCTTDANPNPILDVGGSEL
jgi:membrane-associated phospholipid phosphatase